MRKVIRRSIRLDRDGSSVAGELNAVIAANVGRKGQRTKSSSRSRATVEQPGEPDTGEPGGPASAAPGDGGQPEGRR